MDEPGKNGISSMIWPVSMDELANWRDSSTIYAIFVDEPLCQYAERVVVR